MAAERGNKGCNKGENTPLSWRHLANNVKKITFLIVGVWAVNFTCQKLSKLFKVFLWDGKWTTAYILNTVWHCLEMCWLWHIILPCMLQRSSWINSETSDCLYSG